MHSTLSSSTQTQGFFSGATGGLAQGQNQQPINAPSPPILPGPTTLNGRVRPSIAPAAALMAAALAAQQRQQQQQQQQQKVMPRPVNNAIMTHQPFGIPQQHLAAAAAAAAAAVAPQQRPINLPGPPLPFLQMHNPDPRIMENAFEDPQQQQDGSSSEVAVEEDDGKSPRKRRDRKASKTGICRIELGRRSCSLRFSQLRSHHRTGAWRMPHRRARIRRIGGSDRDPGASGVLRSATPLLEQDGEMMGSNAFDPCQI